MDPDALASSWRQHANGIRELLRDLLGDRQDAEDVAQETWITLLSRPPRAGWSLREWLRGIARRRARDFARSTVRRRRHEAEAPRPTAEDSPASLERFEQIELVVEALRQLSPPNRKIVLLRYYEDLAPTEIAERLALPVATVKSRLQRSLAELRRRLEGRVHFGWVCAGGWAMTAPLRLAGTIALLCIAVPATWLWYQSTTSPAESPSSVVREEVALREEPSKSALASTVRSPVEEDDLASSSSDVPAAPARNAGPAAEASGGTRLRIRVVDPNGVALEGIPVLLQQYQFRQQAWTILARSETQPSPDPLASIAIEESWSREGHASIFVRLPIEPGSSRLIDLARPPVEVIELTVPHLARVAFRIRAPASIPPPEQVDLQITRRPSTSAGLPKEARPSVARSFRISGGAMPSTWVGSPGEYTYFLSDAAERFAPMQGRFPAPLGPGDNGVIELDLGALCPVAIVQIREETGSPFASAGVEATEVIQGGDEEHSQSRALATDTSGTLRVALGMDCPPTARRVLRLRGFADRRLDFGSPSSRTEQQDTLHAEIDLSAALSLGDHDLGIAILRPNREPLLAAGIVVDAAGRPLANVRLTLDRRSEFVDAQGWTRRTWSSTSLTTRSRSDGTFALRGAPELGTVRLFAESDNFVQLELAARPEGCGDWRVVMQPCIWVWGKLLRPPELREVEVRAVESWWQPKLIDPSSRVVDHDLAERGLRRTRSRNEDGFSFSGVRPGPVRVEVLVQGIVVATEHVDLEPSFQGSVRLEPIDLRQRVRAQHLRLRAPNGEPLVSAEITLSSVDEAHRAKRELITGPDGELIAWSASELDAFELRVAGYRAVRFSWRAEPLEIRLEEN
ncbi:MAG: sigma-70 family RNA polymerase sigma factor [Planctomycetes bacterium]|nr:sigma-70 family RNA polymerase sigma factor [Planctomycetota bacterium]